MKKYNLVFLLFACSNVFSAWPNPHISKATFAENVIERSPVKPLSEANNTLKKVYFFTNIRQYSGHKITHRWAYKDRVKAEISFDIKGNRWRVWSSKNLWHRWTGVWKVDVLDENNKILLTQEFLYKEQK
jgi:hypothetical protein